MYKNCMQPLNELQLNGKSDEEIKIGEKYADSPKR